MAGLLSKTKILLIICTAVIFCCSADAFDDFPFEFGHSSDIYLDLKKNAAYEKQKRRDLTEAKEILYEKGIKRSPDDFVKYIKKNDKEAIKLLLNAGFDPNMNIRANYPLYYASKYNKPEIVHILLKAGADPNKDFTSPLRFAILHKDYDMVHDLIDFDAKVNYTDMCFDETLLYTALKKKEYDIAMLLLNSGAKIDNRSYSLIKKKKLEEKLGIIVE